MAAPISQARISQQIGDILSAHGVHVEEVDCCTAVFLLSVNDAQDVVTRVAKWFYNSSGERYFTCASDGQEEYFAIVLFEGQVCVSPVSFGIVKCENRCLSVFDANHGIVSSPEGYVVEIACIESDKPFNFWDFTDAKHIQGKIEQRQRNATHYYPSRDVGQNKEFLVLVSGNARQHAWNLSECVDEDNVTKAYYQYIRDAQSPVVQDDVRLQAVLPLKKTNLWGCLLYDIAAQSTNSASIPRTRLHVPWIVTIKSEQYLTLKVVV